MKNFYEKPYKAAIYMYIKYKVCSVEEGTELLKPFKPGLGKKPLSCTAWAKNIKILFKEQFLVLHARIVLFQEVFGKTT